MPIDYTHEHFASSIIQSGDNPHTPIAVTGNDGDALQIADGQQVVAAPTGGANFNTAAITLTNDQIKLLATDGVEIVPAPGVGNAIIPVSAVLYMDFAAGAYTPSSGSDYFTIGTGTDGAEEMYHCPISNQAAVVVSALGPSGRDSPIKSDIQSLSQLDDAALTISISGNNPTGGHADNTMTVSVFYLTVP